MLLVVETSCDDTSVAVVDSTGDIISNVVSSQDEIHRKYSGVVPELASRRHCETITVILKEALDKAKISWAEVKKIAVTEGPGLVGSLLVGIAGARTISQRYNLPLIPVNHLEAHAYSVEIENEMEYPYISLVASGGHSIVLLINSPHDYRVLGQTRDDAAGEAYDKVAKMLNLGYPGGPEIEKLAQQGDPGAIDFPRPTLTGEKRWNWRIDDYDFSFSGLKTAVYYFLSQNPKTEPANIAASFQQAINDCLVYKTIRAAREHEIKRIGIGGGVVANQNLRTSLEEQAEKNGHHIFTPSFQYCTDNAAMVGYRATQQKTGRKENIRVKPNLNLQN